MSYKFTVSCFFNDLNETCIRFRESVQAGRSLHIPKQITMYTNQYKFKYLEWHSPEEIHDTTMKWQSTLDFIEVEWLFLKELLSDNTLLLLSDDHFEEVQKLVARLQSCKEEIPEIHQMLEEHRNALEVLVDGINELQKEKAFKDRHLLLEFKLNDFNDTYREIKTSIFDAMKRSLKKRKQKSIISKS